MSIIEHTRRHVISKLHAQAQFGARPEGRADATIEEVLTICKHSEAAERQLKWIAERYPEILAEYVIRNIEEQD